MNPGMKRLSLRAAAKVNLFLEITADRPDGYHDLVMVLQSLDLADTVSLVSARTTSIVCSHPLVPRDASNLAWRAVELVGRTYGIGTGVEITIDKRIPVASGLAGGSADAAAVLVGLNILWELGLTQEELQVLGAALGSDVPFCVSGGTALAMGRGERLTPLPALRSLYLVVAKPVDLQVSTAWAYQTFRTRRLLTQSIAHAPSSEMLAALTTGDPAHIAPVLYNDLERVVLDTYPEVKALRERLVSVGALAAMMSGSGPAVLGLAADRAHAEQIKIALATDPQIEAHVCTSEPAGIVLEK